MNKLKIHYKHQRFYSHSKATACGSFSERVTNDLRKVTCKSCQNSSMFKVDLKERRDEANTLFSIPR